MQLLAFFGIEVMIQCREHYTVPDQRAIIYEYSSLILKLAACIDEYVSAYSDVLAKIGIK